MNALAQAKLQERADVVGRAEALQAMAVDQDGRDLTDHEQAALSSFRSRVVDIDKQLSLLAGDFALDQETAANIAKWSGTPVPTNDPHSWRSVGDALWDYLHKDSDRDARQRIAQFEQIAQRSTSTAGRGSDSYIQLRAAQHDHDRAAQHMGTTAAGTTPTAGGFGGLIVSPVSGPIIDVGYSGTPLLNLLGAQDAPSPFGFSRPRIIDPNIDDGAGPQAGGKEKGELPSYKFDVNGENVSMQLAGGYLNVSQQVISWLPGAWDLIIRQLTRRAQRAAEKAVATALTGTANVVTLADATDPAQVRAAFGEAAAKVFDATDAMPTWLATGSAGWQSLYSLTNADGDPVYDNLSISNVGGQATGLPPMALVKALGEDFYLGNGFGVEVYRINLPALEAVEPSVLGRQVAVALAVGTYSPITDETGPVRGGLVKIDAPVVP
jgi:hypothetical protein